MDEKKVNEIQINELKMLDLRNIEQVQICIDETGTKIWINTEYGCALRVHEIKNLAIQDDRVSAEPKVKTLFGGRSDES